MDGEAESEHRGGHDDLSGSTAGEAEASLACNCCRRRKLRCSREVPTCQHCRKTGSECLYETKRAKPGMKAGAIDNLHRRLDALEKVVHQNVSPENGSRESRHSPDDHDGNPYQILSFFAREFQRFNNSRGRDLTQQTSGQSPDSGRPAKRRRLDLTPLNQQSPSQEKTPITDNDDIELLLDAYFKHLHPWIPMVHEGRLRRRLADDREHKNLHIVLQAMLLSATRYVQDFEAAKRLKRIVNHAQSFRDAIVAKAMRRLTVENSQALVMVAFNDIGSGLASQAWSIVGALTRNVEYLQLATENDESDRLRLSQPFTSLPSPQDWTEAEERRRVFWNVFNLDRLCSVMMGWNTSLTSDDVSRRLPCDGIKWRKEDSVLTPYFGIWDKSAGRIGNPLAFLPSHYPATTHPVDQGPQTPSDTATSPDGQSGNIDMSTVGAFAYSIEATESLSRVTTYFLQQRVNMHDQRDLGSWLTRFKELDLRLVHWKMLLPQKWKVDVTHHQNSRMDPNLTLAHVTHNTSMILLHQLIAFPLADWPFKNRLPSLCSVDTCQSAATEVAIIAEKYLKNAPQSVPVSSQLAFCLYISARAFLLLWKYNKEGPLAPQFYSLVESLNIMAKRWVGNQGNESTSIANTYSRKLSDLHAKLTTDPFFNIPVLGYTTEVDHAASDVPHQQDTPPAGTDAPFYGQEGYSAIANAKDGQVEYTADEAGAVHGRQQSTSMATNADDQAHRASLGNGPTNGVVHVGMPAATHNGVNNMTQPNTYHRPSVDLGSISQLLLDQQFVDMDRIISYDDAVFAAEYESGIW